tara:strand:- start:59 stop:508 length:450 start_codon:yes stop_codon:yes gene_type:complete
MAILFGGNTANDDKLDDYEEGTWTPQFTLNSSDAGSYSAREGFYVKVGSLVYCKGLLTLTNKSGSGAAGIGGLPFTIRDDLSGTAQEGFGMLTYWSATNQTSNFIFWVQNGGTVATIQRIHGANTTQNADQNDFSGNSDLRFSVFYCAD